jgi:hypothetical protein
MIRNTYAILLYDNRSGSTLLSSLLNRYEEVSVSLESFFVINIIEYKYSVCKDTLDEFLVYLYKEPQFSELGIKRDKLRRYLLKNIIIFDKRQIIYSIIDLYFKDRDPQAKCRVLKFGAYAYLEEIKELFPEVQFIHIIRDCRAVYNSKKRSKSIEGYYMDNNVVSASFEWKLRIRKCMLLENCLNIRYEDLVENVDFTCKKVLDFLEIENHNISKKSFEYFRKIGVSQKHLHENVKKEPDRKNINNWKETLSVSEIDSISYLNKKELEMLGYKVDKVNFFNAIYFTVYSSIKFSIIKIIRIFHILVRDPELLLKKINKRFRLMK